MAKFAQKHHVESGVLAGWKSYPPALRGEAVNLLAGRKPWATELLAAVGKGSVPRTDLTDNTILRIRTFRDKKLDDQIKAVWGQIRDTPAELNALIDRMRGHLHEGRASFEQSWPELAAWFREHGFEEHDAPRVGESVKVWLPTSAAATPIDAETGLPCSESRIPNPDSRPRSQG